MVLIPAARVMAQEDELTGIDKVIQPINDVLGGFFFFSIGGENGFPFIVLWLFVAAFFFTLRMGFINIRGFKHAIDVVRGQYDDIHDQGEVTHFQALSTALSGTVGLGNIAGVAVAISIGGPGAMVWMTIAGLLGMTSKFVECTLGVKYRRVAPDGTVLGGPAYYLNAGLAQRGLRPVGQGLAILFCILCLGGSIGGGNLFQSNQAYAAVKNVVPTFPAWLFGLIVSALAALVILGGIKRIGAVAGKLVPGMAIIYVCSCLVILSGSLSELPAAIGLIFQGAFAPTAAVGGIIGVMVQGIKRSSFSNEAGVGSASIVHSAARTHEPIREGLVSLLEPFIDTVVICNMTALVIIVSKAYEQTDLEGVEITANAFATVAGWFPILLSIAVCLFAFSTIVTWSYYGIQAWTYLFGERSAIIFKVIYIICTFLGSWLSLSVVIDFTDLLFLGMAFPNLLGCYFLSNEVASDLKNYWDRLASGQMPKVFKVAD
ncbi:Amino-acid carrier protein AlsT [Acaryochloris thomasi RCC1774]|uniref:Amino-acid carrier protein AlsT n=1 Tax=Acaryochloris thomasi RCC1774 TaxID=1764569 RepID=A0A2W1JP05_9CYAN|nr:alanine/glycine:cation symporter family protein [Acaryochloris thomasi]PZD75070.1 Amino-acid carrier protein AlsT [Acaryochloris thomasi RCC1774]